MQLFAYSWKRLAYSGAFLFTVLLEGFFAYSLFFTYSWILFAYNGEVLLISSSTDCKLKTFISCYTTPWAWNCFLSPRVGKLRAWEIDRKGKIPKVLRGGCKRSFGPREQRSPKSLLHHPKPILHRCKSGFGWCKRLFGDLCSLGPKDLLHPPLSTFGNFPFSVNFPGPQLPNPRKPNASSISTPSWKVVEGFLMSFSRVLRLRQVRGPFKNPSGTLSETPSETLLGSGFCSRKWKSWL